MLRKCVFAVIFFETDPELRGKLIVRYYER